MASLDQTVEIPADVLVRVVDGEAVLLNLKTEFYFGLDDVSTEFWHAIDAADTLGAAVAALQEMFDVDDAQLRSDFDAFVNDLLENGLLEYPEAAASSS